MTQRTIVIAAGGTGGHFFPAEALADALAKRGHRLVLMTDARAGARTTGVFLAADNMCCPALVWPGMARCGPLRPVSLC